MKLKATCAAIAAAFATLGAAGAASAQDAEFAFNLGATSDYVFRGFSQTDEDFAIQGGVDVTVGSYYAGAWASNVDFGDDTDAEVDLYAGYRTEYAGFNVDFGGIVYLYVGEPTGAEYNYVEAKLAVSRAIGPVTAGAAVYFSPDFFGADDLATYVEGNASWAATDKLSFSGALGHQSLDVGDDYVTWNVGASYALIDNVALDVRYHDTDVDGPLSEDRVVGTIKLLF